MQEKKSGSIFTEIDLQFMEVGLIKFGVQKISNFILKVLTATKFNSSRRKSINTQSYSSMGL